MVRAPDRKLLKITPESLPEMRFKRSRRRRLAPDIGHNEARVNAFVNPGGTAIEITIAPDAVMRSGFFFGVCVENRIFDK